jgi:hypothetical protein
VRHTLPKSVGRHTCHTRWSFHLKCGEDHDGCRQIHNVPKGSLGSHLGLRNLVHTGHCVLDDQHYEFLGDVLLTVVFAGPSELDNLRYAFPVAYWDVKASRR